MSQGNHTSVLTTEVCDSYCLTSCLDLFLCSYKCLETRVKLVMQWELLGSDIRSVTVGPGWRHFDEYIILFLTFHVCNL